MAAKRPKTTTKSTGEKPPVRRRALPFAPPEPIAPPTPAEEPVVETPAAAHPRPTAPKKKVVLVDGPSLSHPNVRRVLDISQFNYHGLCKLLSTEIAEGEMAEPAIYTVQPSLPQYIMKLINVAGFNVAPIKTEAEADDFFLIQEIRGLDATKIGSLVLVTNDGSFADAARDAKARGIAVYWVTVEGFNRDGRPFVGVNTRALIESEFTGVDLRQYADRIRFREWEERPRQDQPPVEQKTTIAFRVQVPTRDLGSVMTQLQGMIEKYNISIEFEN